LSKAGVRSQGSGVRLPPLPAEFVGSFPDPLHPLQPSLPEIAFLGRSNVGKSSLLNALAGRKALARVSAAPGKTELLNVYRVGAGYWLDLPGYGFSKRSKTARVAFRALLEGVAGRRPSLSGVVWLLDVRHPPSQDDYAIQELLAKAGRPVLAVLTKADKFSATQRSRALVQRARELGMAADELLLTSSTTKLGIEELRESILTAVSGSGER
jgi:GTP-binding protein